MTCDDADLLLAAHAVGALAEDEHAPLRAHLLGCEHCRQEGARYLAAAQLLPVSVDLIEAPATLRSRIMAQVHAEASGGRVRREPWWRRAWRAVPTGRGLTLAGGVAGLAAAALLAVVGVRAVQSSPAAPATATVRACGTTAEPSACGTLTWDPAIHRAVLDVAGLPAPTAGPGVPAGSYEVWLIRANGSAVPAAFLTLQPDGSTWSAAIRGDVSGYVALATTREPAGGSHSGPTGTEVLRVALPDHTG